MSTRLTITWRQQSRDGRRIERWYASGFEYGDPCGGIWQERGQYRAEVWPRGRGVVGAYYRSPRHAMRHVERWLQAHPGVACAALDPRGMKGRISHRPDPELWRFVREHGPLI